MATKIQMNLLQANKTYETLYPETIAEQISSGTLDVTRIPDLPATKITSNTLDINRIPDLSTSKITSGVFNNERIPTISASKVSAGTFATKNNSTGYVFQSNVRIKNDDNHGMKLNLGDGDYVYLHEDKDDHLTIKGDKGINLVVGSSYNVTVNGQPIGGDNKGKTYPILITGTGGNLTVDIPYYSGAYPIAFEFVTYGRNDTSSTVYTGPGVIFDSTITSDKTNYSLTGCGAFLTTKLTSLRNVSDDTVLWNQSGAGGKLNYTPSNHNIIVSSLSWLASGTTYLMIVYYN